MRVGILTVSDRSSRGEREDLGGPAVERALLEGGEHAEIAQHAIVADERAQISAKLIEWCDVADLDLILTTGGTGFTPRDVTPEATVDVLERQAPGIAEAIRAAGMRTTPHAMLGRGVSGIRKHSLIVNLPGSPRGAVESLGVIMPVLSHAVELLRGEASAEAHHR